LISIILVLASVTVLYIGIALMWVINRLPLLGTTLESIGIVMTGVFVYRNLWTTSKRQVTFDRIISYRDAISGKKPDPIRTVSTVEATGDLSNVQAPNVPVTPAAPVPVAIASTPQRKSNGVDELRYLFLASQVELIDDASKLAGLQHQATSEGGKIGVTSAEGEKCDRCWNYSPTVGHNSEHPLVCDRCVDALAGSF
jgi:isoleucyl-tRNA synthetase